MSVAVEVLTVVHMKSTVFRDVSPHNLLRVSMVMNAGVGGRFQRGWMNVLDDVILRGYRL
jgi:hypothetical protein